jgi:hypothetical protein
MPEKRQQSTKVGLRPRQSKALAVIIVLLLS